MKRQLKKLNERGMALLMALFAMTLLTFIALEVSYDTNVDYIVATQQVNRIKAYYAAKSAVELSLLRIMFYKQAMAALGDSLGANKQMLDPIWSMPFMWPPPETGQISEVNKSMMNSVVAESLMEAKYQASIQPEGGKIDVNDLGSPIKALKKIMIQQVLKIFQTELQNNDAFRRKHSGYRFEELVNNIADYIDEDTEGLNGGDESQGYRDIRSGQLTLPPNRPLRTLDELHQVAGMRDEFFELLKPRLTVFGVKGINVNYAEAQVLAALDPSMTKEIVDKAITRRSDLKQGGPFRDGNDFLSFIGGLGANRRAIEESKVPLFFDTEFNFRITASGFTGNVQRKITVVTYDYLNLSPRFTELLDKQDQQDFGTGANGSAGVGTTSPSAAAGATSGANGAPANPAQKIQGAKGRPTVVYWEEN